MVHAKVTTRFRFWLWLIRLIGVIVPQRLRADWKLEWEAELQHREQRLGQWDRLDGEASSVSCDAALAHSGSRSGCSVNVRRTKCFKTYVMAFECCSKPGFTLICYLHA